MVVFDDMLDFNQKQFDPLFKTGSHEGLYVYFSVSLSFRSIKQNKKD